MLEWRSCRTASSAGVYGSQTPSSLPADRSHHLSRVHSNSVPHSLDLNCAGVLAGPA